MILAIGSLHAQSAPKAGGTDPFEAEPAFAELGALPSPESLASLERMALLSSGAAPERLSAYEARLGELFSALRSDLVARGIASGGEPGGSSSAAEAVLAFLHRSVFKAYREDATTLDGILDTGRYNCVSSAVLYALAAKSLGIEAEGARTPDHAFCTVLVEGRRVDVETTNPYGFDPGNKKEFRDSFGRATGYAYVAPGAYGNRRQISLRELVGLILSNRASSLERSGRFAEATRLGADYAALCPGGETRSFLLDRINNLVADLGQRRDFKAAEENALAAQAAFPTEKRIASLAATASYNRAAALAQAGNWAGAFDRAAFLLGGSSGGTSGGSSGGAQPQASTALRSELGELARSSLLALARKAAQGGDFAAARLAVAERLDAAGGRPELAPYAAEAYAEIADMELVKAANVMAFAEGLAAAERLRASGGVGLGRWAQALAAIYGREAARIGKAGDFLGAARTAEAGMAALDAAGGAEGGASGKAAPQSDSTAARELPAARASLAAEASAMRGNFAAAAHNRFAALYNSGDYAAAEAALEEALATLPGNAMLERDLASIKAAK